jgi:hypothetical protein
LAQGRLVTNRCEAFLNVRTVDHGDRMTQGRGLSGLLAGLLGLAAFATFGALTVLYMTDMGAEVMRAVIAAVTPSAHP